MNVHDLDAELESFHSRYKLTRREIELAGYVIQGYANRKIAGMCSLSIYTVKTHMANLFEKTGVHSRQEFIRAYPTICSSEEQSLVFSRLTRRQIDVLQLIADGKTNREIAEILGISKYTVKTHVSEIYRELKPEGIARIYVMNRFRRNENSEEDVA